VRVHGSYVPNHDGDRRVGGIFWRENYGGIYGRGRVLPGFGRLHTLYLQWGWSATGGGANTQIYESRALLKKFQAKGRWENGVRKIQWINVGEALRWRKNNRENPDAYGGKRVKTRSEIS